MTEAAPALPLATRWFGLRFLIDRTEGQYRKWRVGAAIPFVRVGYIGSVPSWALLLLANIVLEPDSLSTAGPMMAAWILLLVVLAVLTVPTALHRSVMPLAALANCMAGFLVVWLLFDVVAEGSAPQFRAGLMVSGMLIVMFFGFAIFRIPPLLAIAAVTPYIGFASWHLYDSYDSGDMSRLESGGLAAGAWIAYCGCVLVSTVIEIVNRRTFSKDQIISTQQRELQGSREAIRRYVPPAVADHILHGDLAGIDVPSRRRITVMFTDMVGFTALADRVEAEELTQIVSDYMSTMSQIVDQHGGTVNEFAGDGLMALFGAPDELSPEEQVHSAVLAGLAMQERLPSLNQGWFKLGIGEPLRMRIGINTGVLSVGSFGSQGRMTYTAIGLHTNVASRIQSACEPGGILLSDTSWHLVKDRIPCEPRGEVECKGLHYPVRVHSPKIAVPVTFDGTGPQRP